MIDKLVSSLFISIRNGLYFTNTLATGELTIPTSWNPAISVPIHILDYPGYLILQLTQFQSVLIKNSSILPVLWPKPGWFQPRTEKPVPKGVLIIPIS